MLGVRKRLVLCLFSGSLLHLLVGGGYDEGHLLLTVLSGVGSLLFNLGVYDLVSLIRLEVQAGVHVDRFLLLGLLGSLLVMGSELELGRAGTEVKLVVRGVGHSVDLLVSGVGVLVRGDSRGDCGGPSSFTELVLSGSEVLQRFLGSFLDS